MSRYDRDKIGSVRAGAVSFLCIIMMSSAPGFFLSSSKTEVALGCLLMCIAWCIGWLAGRHYGVVYTLKRYDYEEE